MAGNPSHADKPYYLKRRGLPIKEAGADSNRKNRTVIEGEHRPAGIPPGVGPTGVVCLKNPVSLKRRLEKHQKNMRRPGHRLSAVEKPNGARTPSGFPEKIVRRPGRRRSVAKKPIGTRVA